MPVFLVLTPVSLVIIFHFQGIYANAFTSQIGYTILSSYALFNGLFTIVFVTPYRHHFLNQLAFLKLDRLLVRLKVINKSDAPRGSILVQSRNSIVPTLTS